MLAALVTLWIQRGVPESGMWEEHHRLAQDPAGGRGAASLPVGKLCPAVRAALSEKYRSRCCSPISLACSPGGAVHLDPAYLSLPAEQGGRGFGVMGTTGLLIFLNLAGMFPGYAGFGWVADRFGRRKSFIAYTLLAAFLVPLYAAARSATTLLLLGALVAFFGTGFFSGSGIIGSEIFPTRLRARALGFTYNGARTLSSIAPFVIGRVGQARGLGWAFYLCAGSFLLSALAATMLPETKGKHLE